MVMIDENLKETVSYLVYESSQTRLDRVIHKLVVAVIIAVSLLFISNALWLWAWTHGEHTTTTVSQDGSGINIVGDENAVGGE